MNEKLMTYLESSFLSPYFQDQNITDISYNGVNIFYQHNLRGRLKADFSIDSATALDFIRQIANYSEKQFSCAVPILDISVGRYRINAVHSSLVRVGDDKSISFSIRIASSESKIRNNQEFMPEKVDHFLQSLLRQKQSIVIGGPTGSGKTELQKYLLSSLPNNSRVVVIDNIQELENIRANDDIDLTSWQVSPHSLNGSFEELIRNALRSNPDWLVVSEARGKEMADVLNSAMTGHPIITTLHAKSVTSMPHRMVRMIEMAGSVESYEDIMSDISEHLRFYVFVNRHVDDGEIVHRYVESIAAFDDELNMQFIYDKNKNEIDEAFIEVHERKSSEKKGIIV